MTRPAIFFDRDNTLIACDGYLGDPSQVRLIDGAADAVARARDMGFATVVFSNQSGVARGMFAEEDVRAVNARMDELLLHAHPEASIDRHDFCPFHPEAAVDEYRRDSELRKPRPGMILGAAREMSLDLSRSWVVGDAPRDIEAGHAVGCRTILVRNGALPQSPTAEADSIVQPDFLVGSIKEAMDVIEQASGSGPDDPQEVQPQPAPSSSESEPSDRIEPLLSQILFELRRRNEQTHHDFSVPKLLAGIVQVLVLAVLFLCYLNRSDASLHAMLMVALVLQTMVVALLLMGRGK
jgi:D-glycero-D-manno-heptose 1,7-bisphosphate phosphatase